MSKKAHSGDIVYSRRNFCIISVGHGYIVVNMKERIDRRTARCKKYYNKEVKKGGMDKLHTHVKSYNTAVMLINCCIKETLPTKSRWVDYFIVSLLRISNKEQKDYRNRLELYKETLEHKGKQKYYNSNKGVRH